MKTAMYRAHKMTYEEYDNDVHLQLYVERKREREFAKEMEMLSRYERKILT